LSRRGVIVGFFVMTLILSSFSCITATTVWSDDFSDGDYDGWTVTRGSLSAADGVLRGLTTTWNWINHPSTVANGTWNFDVYYMGIEGFNVWFICNYLNPVDYYNGEEGYGINFWVTGGNIRLLRDHSDTQTVLDTYDPESLDGWWNFTITRDLTGRIDVYINGVLRLQATDTMFNSSSYFVFETYNTQAIDNIVVKDVVEQPITTPTTTPTTSTIPSTPTETQPGGILELLLNPIVFAALITAIATILAAWIKSRSESKKESKTQVYPY
jgi:hypothetical protein